MVLSKLLYAGSSETPVYNRKANHNQKKFGQQMDLADSAKGYKSCKRYTLFRWRINLHYPPK